MTSEGSSPREGQRPQALSPAGLESLVQHAEQAGFLWALRDAATVDPRYDLERLHALDERVEAHLDGLRRAGDAGWQAAQEGLRAPDAGAVFIAAVLALEREDRRGVARVLDVAVRTPKLTRGLASALGWVPFAVLRGILPGLLDPRCPPPLHWLGIAGCAAHRKDPVPSLEQAVGSRDPRLARRAMVAAGELGRMDLMPWLHRAFLAEDDALRFSAAWAATLLGDPAGPQVLVAVAQEGGAHAEEAARMAVRTMAPADGTAFVRDLGPGRRALAGAGALGDPALVPWIVEQMADPEIARPAAAALVMVTGVDIESEDLSARAPLGTVAGPGDMPADDEAATARDEGLPWPAPAAVEAWWGQRKSAFAKGKRYLGGQPVSPAWLAQVLRKGRQPARATAAVELCLAGERRVLFAVRARSTMQWSALEAAALP